MRIENLSKFIINCKVDDWCICIPPYSSFECLDDFNTLTFTPNKKSYSTTEAGKSKTLKALSFFDDPFKLIKEYHLTVSSLFSKDSIRNSHKINITMNTFYADTETRTYYDFVTLVADESLIKPLEVSIWGQDEIQEDFKINNSNLTKWKAVWNLIVEPLFFEIVGYYAIYRICSVWFQENAWKIVLFLILSNILFEVLMLFLRRGRYKKRTDKFLKLFFSKVIYHCCYNQPKY